MRLKSSLLVAIVVMLAVLAAPAAAQSDRPSAKKSKAPSASPPMIFYLAKGEDDVCGRGCNEWIAAEGQIDAGAAERLRAFLGRLGKRKLPIFFHSPGGNGLTSTIMGRLLRAREMTAGVYQTVPAGCVGASDQACRALKRSGQVLPSALRNVAGCNSACVFALIGAKVRQVPPGALLGVHSAKLVMPVTEARNAGFSDRQIASYQKNRLAELNAQFRRYVEEMKIDVRLFDLLSKVPHEKVHFLSRSEIAQFGIDTREFLEARWTAADMFPQRVLTMKYFVEARVGGRKELRTSVVQLECAGPQRARIGYARGLGSGESGVKRTISLAVDNRSVAFSGAGTELNMDTVETGVLFSVWTAHAPFDVLEAAAARDYIEMIETDAKATTSRTTRLSTAGLSQAVNALREHCGRKPDCAPPESWVAGTLPPSGTAAPGSPNWTAGTAVPHLAAGAPSPNCAVPFMNVR